MAGDWEWRLTETARRDFEALDDEAQRRIAGKLDDVVEDPWRDPADHVESLQNASHGKLRIGQFRVGCRPDHGAFVLWILRIRRRGADAYRGDD